MKDYRTILNIPEGKSGDHEIHHTIKAPGEKVTLGNFRTAIIGGQKGPPHVTFDVETRWHSLTYDGGTWMTDLPIEQRQHDTELEPVNGTVLVGGLGLGYAATTLALRNDVERVVVVELSPDVIKLVEPHLLKGKPERDKLEVVNANLFDFLKETREGFNYGFYDIWQSDGEGTFHKVVVPLRELSRDVCDEVICWNEDVMRGQLAGSLHSQLMLMLLSDTPLDGFWKQHIDHLKANPLWEPETPKPNYDPIWHDWSVPFWRWWYEKGRHKGDDAVLEGLRDYAGMYGLAGWETLWRYRTKND